MDTKIYK